MRRLAAIEHVKIVRFHTRVPVVEPARIDAALIAALKASGKTTYVALHANHPRELTPEARAACARLVDAGIVMVSQSVLLQGVNDDPRDAGRAHARLRGDPHQALLPAPPGSRARHEPFPPDHRGGPAVGRGLRGRISGLCQPTYILDIPGGHGKAVIGPDAIRGPATAATRSPTSGAASIPIRPEA